MGCKKIAHVACAQLVGWELVIEYVEAVDEHTPRLSANVYCAGHRRNPPGANAEEQSELIAEFIKQKTLGEDETKGERRQKSWQLDSVGDVEGEKGLKTRCAECRVDASPIWWPESAKVVRGKYLCQICHIRRGKGKLSE
jgi:hypothetical protein